MNKSDTSQTYDVVIVGSGFSGVVAAGILAEHGLNILMVDENLHVGGQLLRKIPGHLGDIPNASPDYVKRTGFAFVQNVKQKKITIMNRTCVIGIYPGNRLMMESQRKEILDVTAGVLLFATGARERYIPFKGWTLPGVYSTGMVQVMMKSSGIIPAKKILVGGSGLFLFSVAYECLKNNAKVLAVLEQTPMLEKIKLLPQLIHQWPKVAEGGKYLSKLFFSGVSTHYRRKIIEARGNGILQEVITGKVDRRGTLIPGTEKIYKTEALAVGYGFVPNIEAPQLAGCKLHFDSDLGGWIVDVNEQLETSVENILAAGEITGVGGGLKSMDEGKMAALTILNKFRKIDEQDYHQRMMALTKKRNHHLGFARCFNSLYRPAPETLLDIPDDTIVCRCEDITIGEIKKGIANGYDNPMALKSGMRLSMGNCQGRTCGPLVYDIVHAVTGRHPEKSGPFKVRPPLKPVSIEALAKFDNTTSKKDN